MYGRGAILRINLSSQKISKESMPPQLCRKFLGGEGINAWLLWEHFLKVDPRIDPLSPDNVLIAGIGPLAATGFPAGSKMQFTYKSPAYNLYGDTSSGGGFGSQLRWAGYDHIVITGKAKHPIYIWVNDDSVQIRDARHLWGKGIFEANTLIKDELGDEEVETACIGQAGENLVRFASIMVSCHRAAARGGGGCVFGSKNLKAIAARGTKGLAIFDPQALFEASEEFREYKQRDPGAGYHLRHGTIDLVRDAHLVTGLECYRNHQGHLAPEDSIDKLGHNWYANNIGVHTMACSPSCGFACGGWYHIKGNESPSAKRFAGEWGTKPEYGAVSAFGSECDLPDLPAVCHLNKMCNDYGLDVHETGAIISFLMELWGRGIITQEDTTNWTGGPLSLEWGNYEAIKQIIDAMALRKNELGKILSGGVYKTALWIEEIKNVPVLKYVCYGKAGAAHGGTTRATVMGLALAMVPTGAHHVRGMGVSPSVSLKYFGKPDAGEPLFPRPDAGKIPMYTLKGAGQALSEIFAEVRNSLGVCFFLCSHGTLTEIPLETMAKALWAITGVRLTPEELIIAGERVTNIQKAFNSRLGLRRKDDTVCYRYMNEPILEGPATGCKVGDYLEAAKDEYYEYRGWNKETSLQTKRKLEELDIPDIARVLAKEGTLADVGKKRS